MRWNLLCLPCLRDGVQLLAVSLSKQAGLQAQLYPTAASYQERCWHEHVWLILLCPVGAAEELANLCLLAASWPVLHLLCVKTSRTLLSTANKQGQSDACVFALLVAMARKCSDFSTILLEVVSAPLDMSCALIPSTVICHMVPLVSACRKQINVISLPSTSLLFSPTCCDQCTLRLRVCVSPCALWEWRDESSIVFPALPSLQRLTRSSAFLEETNLQTLGFLMSQCFFELNKAQLKPKC